MTRRVLVSNRLPQLRSGNAEIDRWVEQYLQAFVSQVFEQISFLTPETESFTPTLFGGSTAGTYELASNRSWYYKLGDLVFASIDFTLDNPITAGGTGSTIISGLPFEKVETYNSIWAVSTSGVDLSGHQIVANMDPNTEAPTVHLNEVQDDGATVPLAIGSFAADDVLTLSGFYVTNGERSA